MTAVRITCSRYVSAKQHFDTINEMPVFEIECCYLLTQQKTHRLKCGSVQVKMAVYRSIHQKLALEDEVQRCIMHGV